MIGFWGIEFILSVLLFSLCYPFYICSCWITLKGQLQENGFLSFILLDFIFISYLIFVFALFSWLEFVAVGCRHRKPTTTKFGLRFSCCCVVVEMFFFLFNQCCMEMLDVGELICGFILFFSFYFAKDPIKKVEFSLLVHDVWLYNFSAKHGKLVCNLDFCFWFILLWLQTSAWDYETTIILLG